MTLVFKEALKSYQVLFVFLVRLRQFLENFDFLETRLFPGHDVSAVNKDGHIREPYIVSLFRISLMATRLLVF